MQLLSWTMGRLGSRFSLLFEPYQRRVMHSGLGRFLDEPLDLMVGLIEPDGTERVLPFTHRGQGLFNCEQFERMNSITFRGYSEKYSLRLEFNIHGVFYPQDEDLCLLPVFYLEMRVSPVSRVRWTTPQGPTPEKVKLFIRLQRPNTRITAQQSADGQQTRLDLEYSNRTHPNSAVQNPEKYPALQVQERIVSLNPQTVPDADGQGLTVELPVTPEGSGVKWRLVWGSYCGQPVLSKPAEDQPITGRLRYTHYWNSIDQVMDEALRRRDTHLALSRRFEKLFDQAPLFPTQRHLIHQTFQAYLANTFWADLSNGQEWFSVWEGSCFFHSTVDVEYNVALFYLAMWPGLLAMELNQWADYGKDHSPSKGAILSHDMGIHHHIGAQAYHHDMPVEENANYLLLMQAYVHWTGDLSPAQKHSSFLERLSRYLLWSDREACGFPTEGAANTIDDASPATQYARKQTYLAVKRLAALSAAGDLLERLGQVELAKQCQQVVAADASKIEKEAWQGDHFAVCIDRSAAGLTDAWTGQALPYDELPGWDAYSIYTANGLLLPAMVGQPHPFNQDRLNLDLVSAARESLGRYGCGHTSYEPENVWVSQNLWRDHAARYLGVKLPRNSQLYWDLQAMSNTHDQSFGFIDTYINNQLCFYPRGITCMGWLLAEPRLIIDRLDAKGPRISVEPDTSFPQRWPLFPLADWKAGKIPVCVVDAKGKVSIEGQIDPIEIRPTSPSRNGKSGN